jgi:GWxTD domain-containing protein
VVAINHDPHQYAVALTALEQTRWLGHDASMAATGGNLMRRIRRLLKQPGEPRTALTPVFSAGILTLTAALVLTAWQATPPSDSPYARWINEEVVYIISDSERASFNDLRSDAERDNFIEQFWLRRDPTPGTPANEFKIEHYRRLKFVNERFTNGQSAGWKTDRGHVYIVHGPPDEIETHPTGSGSKPPYEQWLYRWVEGVGTNVVIEFVDANRSGDFRMTRDPN